MGATINYNLHEKYMWFHVIFTVTVTAIGLFVSSMVLDDVFVDYVITTSYIIETYTYTIVMSQFFLLQCVSKTRFRALNGLFWWVYLICSYSMTVPYKINFDHKPVTMRYSQNDNLPPRRLSQDYFDYLHSYPLCSVSNNPDIKSSVTRWTYCG